MAGFLAAPGRISHVAPVGRQLALARAGKKGHYWKEAGAGCLGGIFSNRNATGLFTAMYELRGMMNKSYALNEAADAVDSGVRARWRDKRAADDKAAVAGSEDNLKTLPDTYASEDDALGAARAEMGRIERGAATLEIELAIGQPALMVRTPVNVRGFKQEIDGTDWLCKAVEHTLGDNGLTTRLELERRGEDGASGDGEDEDGGDGDDGEGDDDLS